MSYSEAKALIGQRIKEARLNCGRPQDDLAKVLFAIKPLFRELKKEESLLMLRK